MTKKLLLAIMLTLALTGCRYIDDDTSDCKNCEETLTLNFQLQVVADVKAQVDAQLNGVDEASLRQSLTACLSPLMAPKEYHAKLMFYDVSGVVPPTIYPETFTGLSITEHTTLPPADYHLLAVTGTDDDRALLADSFDVTKTHVVQPHADTVASHRTVILAGRKDIVKNAKGTIVIPLYPVNAAVAVVTREAPEVRDVDIFLSDFSDGYLVSDSTYCFSRSQLVKAERQQVDIPTSAKTGAPSVAPASSAKTDSPSVVPASSAKPDAQRASAKSGAPFVTRLYTALTMPSRDKVEEGENPTLWKVYVVAHLADGTLTRTILTIHDPLRAGDIKVIDLTIGSDGAAQSSDLNVGASVTLDWKKGGGYNPGV